MAQKFSRRIMAKTIAAQIIAGAKMSVLARRIAAYLVVNKMTNQTEMLLGDVAYELSSQNQHLFATAKTAHPLTTELREQIIDYLKQHSGISQVELAEVTDGALVGGVLIETPSETRDASIRAKLRRLQQA